MPKAETSAAGRIVNFFRTANLEVAELVLGLSKDVVLERKRATPALPPAYPGPSTVLSSPAVPAKKAAKKRSHKKKKDAPTQPPLEEAVDQGVTEAGDAPPPA